MGKNFKLLLSFLLCLLGMATKAQTSIDIGTVDELKAFRDAVNSGNSYAGTTVNLTADLDLSSEANWKPIGNLVAYPSQSFNGTFNGNNHTISNLTCNDNTPNHAVAGLFGSVVNGTIKDLIVKDVNITSTHFAGGIVAYTSNGPTIENCKVVGGTITSTPEIINGSYDNGDKVGGIMGYATAGSTINNCSVQDVTITAYRDMGGIVGFSAGTVTNNTVRDVTVNQDLTNGYKDSTPTTIGDIIGRDGGATLSNNIVAKSIAKIGSTKYYSIAEAVAAATEGQTVEVFVAGSYTLPGISNNITIEGTVDGVVFDHTGSGSIASIPNGATFKNVAFNFGNNNYHGFHHAGTINMEDCTLNGKLFSYSEMNFTNCEFNQTNSDYHMWTYSGNVTYTGCTFTNSATGKFLNVYHEGGKPTYTVTVTDCKFVNQASAANKAALNVKATSGSNLLAFDVIINNCTTEGAFPEANWGNTLVVLNNLAQVDDRTADGVDNITVTQDDVLIYPAAAVAKIGEKGYPTLQSAVNAAQQMGGAVTINIVDDISGETVTIQEVANFQLTIDGKKDASSNYTVDATIVIDGLRGNGGSPTNGASVTLQNIAFVNGEAKDVIKPSHYPHDLIVQDCTYTGSSTSSNNWFLNVSDGPLYGATVKNITVENSRLINANLAEETVFENIIATTGCTVGFNVKTSGTALIKNCQVTTAKYAFRDFTDAYEGTFTLEDNTFISTSEGDDEGAIVNRGGKVGTGFINVVSGTYTGHVRVLNDKEGVLAISGGYFSEEFPQEYIAADLTAAGKICVPAPDKEGYYTIGEPAVAKYNNVTYPSLQAAIDAAEADDQADIVIDLLDDCTLDITAWDGTQNPLAIGTVNTNSITINGNGKKLTFIYKNSDWNNVATMNDAATKLILNNMAITHQLHPKSGGTWNGYDIGFNCAVELNNVTSDKALAFKNDATLKNVTITETHDYYGIWVSARGQNVSIDGLNLTSGRGIKIDDQYVDNPAKVTLDIANATFNTSAKSAILLKSAGGVEVTAGEGIDISKVAKDTENLVWVDEDKAEEYYKYTTAGATMVPEAKESDYVAKLIDTDNTILGYYKALNKAVTTATEGQTVAILQANTYTLPGLPLNITVEGAVDGVVFEHTTAGNVAEIPNGATFKNVTFTFGNNDYTGFQHAGTINMEDCTFNGKFFSYSDMNFTNCEFNQTNSDYHMWAYAGNVTYTGCTFTNSKTGKFLNIYNEDGTIKYTVTVNNCKFVNEASANKAALNVKATCGAKLLAYDVIINDCTTEGAFPEANWGDKLVVLNSVAQVDDRTDSGVDNITVTQDDVLIYPVYVAQIGEQGYPTLQSAVNAAHEMTGDVTIELLKDIEGYSIVHQKAGLNLTIDGKEFTLNGQIIIDGDGRNTGTETLTIQNFKFEGDGTNFCSGTDAFILVPNTKTSGTPYYNPSHNNHAHNVTITDCTFNGEYPKVVGLKTNSGTDGSTNIVMKNVTATNLHSLAQLTATTGATFDNCSATQTGSFIAVNGGGGVYTISNCTFESHPDKADGYAYREKSNSSAVATLTNNNFKAHDAIILGSAGTINVESGTYVGEISKTAGTIAISGGHFSAPLGNSAYAQFIAEGLSGVNGIYATETPEAPNGIGEAVASVTEGTVVTNYASLESAIAAANDGATVTLLTNCTGNGIVVPQGKFTTVLTVDFANFTYTVDGSTVGSTGTETNGFQLLKDNKITFKNGTITSEKAKILVQNYSDLTLEGMTLTLNNAGYSSAYTLSNNNGNIVIDGSTINANPAGGFAFDVCRYSSYPSVNVTVKGESVINGDIEVYASGSDAKDGLGLTLEAGTFNGDIVLDATAKAILNATPEKAVITKDNTLTSVAAPADFKWVDNGDGTSTLAPCEYVAQIDEVKYESLADAVAAVQDGETILMIADVPNAGGISVPSGKNFTVDFDEHTYTLNKPGAGSTGTETSGFQLLMNSNITFKNGTINISEDNLTPAVAPAKNIMRIIQNYANLTLDNMTIDGTNQYGGKDYVLSFNNGTSVIKDSKVIAGDDVIAFDVCRYASYPSVNVTVKGESEINGDIEVYASGNDPKDGMYLTVEGGTINGKLRLTEEGATAITETSDKAAVKKNNDVDLDAPADYKWLDNGDGTSTLVPCEYICAIGTTKYETLAEAVAAAGTNAATITLLTEAATDGVISGNGVVVPKGSNITFDLNGLTYNVSGETVGSSTTETQGFQLLKESNITFKNGTLKATATTAQMIIQNYCNLTLTDVTLDGRGLSGWAYALSNNCGTINLTGSTSIIAKEGGRAFDTCKFGSYAIPTVNINTTGTISGPIEATGGKLNIENGKFDVTWNTDSHYAAGDIQITGGIYTAEVPEEYCAEGYVCTDNEDEATKATYPYTVMENELAGVFDLVDWEPYPYTGETKKTPRISYTRDTTHDGKVIDNPNTFRSWYVPFDYTIKAEDLESAEFFKIHLIAASAEEGGEVTDNTQVFIHIERLNAGDKMKGNRPYVVRYKEAGTYKYEEENTTIYKADAESSRLYMATSEWDYNFYGTYDSFQATKPLEWMSLSKSTGSIMMNATAAAKLQQYRWYIRVTANTINDDYSNIRFGFVVDGEEGEATSIFAVEGEAQGSDEISGIYSVNGTKYGTTMDDLQKGVNIVRYKNGTTKKVLVK